MISADYIPKCMIESGISDEFKFLPVQCNQKVIVMM